MSNFLIYIKSQLELHVKFILDVSPFLLDKNLFLLAKNAKVKMHLLKVRLFDMNEN